MVLASKVVGASGRGLKCPGIGLRSGLRVGFRPSLARGIASRPAARKQQERHVLSSSSERRLVSRRAVPEEAPEEAPEESSGENRKVLKNVFYVASAVALPIVAWSEVVTITTGSGLQGNLLGALEGVSYLVLLGLVGKSIALKVRTGTGLPAGPYGLIGAMEGLAYLLVVGFIVSQVLHK
mmetsp:Transcript_29461/g.62528  ORF Transcript_29461/g.62528 Transcript_29461/m.62528 type:complete len:181 (-) Transcript_29461:132-674(-)